MGPPPPYRNNHSSSNRAAKPPTAPNPYIKKPNNSVKDIKKSTKHLRNSPHKNNKKNHKKFPLNKNCSNKSGINKIRCRRSLSRRRRSLSRRRRSLSRRRRNVTPHKIHPTTPYPTTPYITTPYITTTTPIHKYNYNDLEKEVVGVSGKYIENFTGNTTIGGNSAVGGNTILSRNELIMKNLAKDIYDFENSYNKYTQCKMNNDTNCDVFGNAYIKAYNKVMTGNSEISHLNNFVNSQQRHFNNSNNRDEVINKYNDDLLKLRKQLDNKMRRLNDIENSFNDDKILYNSTYYNGIIWTIIASSLLYYVFVHIK